MTSSCSSSSLVVKRDMTSEVDGEQTMTRKRAANEAGDAEGGRHNIVEPDSQDLNGPAFVAGSQLKSTTTTTTASMMRPPGSTNQNHNNNNLNFYSRLGLFSQPAPTIRKSPPMHSTNGAFADPLAESRTIYKVKRFLFTLIQFAKDISPETGEKVKELVFNLVAGTITVDDFRQVLQEVTHFPLRPFVLPFLRSNIPLLSRDVAAVAMLTGQTPLQYLRGHQHLILDLSNGYNGSDMSDIFHPSRVSNLNGGSGSGSSRNNNKRRLHVSGETNDNNSNSFATHSDDSNDQAIGSNKRTKIHHRLSEQDLHSLNGRSHYPSPTSGQVPRMNGHSWTSFSGLTVNPGTAPSPQSSLGGRPERSVSNDFEDEWKNIHVMLNCILGMVDKTKRALSILQQKQANGGTFCNLDAADPAKQPKATTAHLSPASQTPISTPGIVTSAQQPGSKTLNDLLAATIKSTEERVFEVRRRAEEAVQEVKRAAMAELQRAMALADQRAFEPVSDDRLNNKTDLLLDGAKANFDKGDEDGQISCWNCGRPATETCSGCNVAKYCSQFCQHKDWEIHHKICKTKKEKGDTDNIAVSDQEEDDDDEDLIVSVDGDEDVAKDLSEESKPEDKPIPKDVKKSKRKKETRKTTK